MKRVFIIHCWQGTPNDFWYPWLKNELEKKGFDVYLPDMPDTDKPKIEPWVSTLQNLVGKMDEETYFIGHSIGCQTILRFLERASDFDRLGGIVFVAPWLALKGLKTEEEIEIAKPWLEPLNNPNIFRFTPNKLITIFSKDDPYVPIENADKFKESFGAQVVIEDGKGHYDSEDVTELPIALENLLKLSND